MKRHIKRILVICLIFIVMVILGVLIWWNRPFSRMDMRKVSDSSAVLQADIPSFSGSPIRTFLVNMTEQSFSHIMNAGFKEKIVKSGLPFIFPQEIKFFIIPKPTIEQPTFLLAIDCGKAIRVVQYGQDKIEGRLFQGSPVVVSILGNYRFTKRARSTALSMKVLNACVWIDSGIIASNDPEYLEKWVQGYNTKTPTSQFPKDSINISIDNRSSFLTQKIRAYEKKYDYDIFSSIDKVESVEVQMVPENPNTMTGTIVFHGTTELNDDSPMVSDVNFFYGVLRRGLRPRGIEIKGEESHKEKNSNLTLEMTGFNTVISQIENPTEESQ